MGALDGKIPVITGGNSGIGLATAKRFVKEGAYVFITGRRQEELNKAVSLIGNNVTAVQGDVSNLDDLDHLYDVVQGAKGHVDIVFANAGVVDPVSLMSSTPESYDKHFNLNARGVFHRSKSTSAACRQSLNHPFWIGRMADGHSWLRRIFGDESGAGLLLSVVGPRNWPGVAFGQT